MSGRHFFGLVFPEEYAIISMIPSFLAVTCWCLPCPWSTRILARSGRSLHNTSVFSRMPLLVPQMPDQIEVVKVFLSANFVCSDEIVEDFLWCRRYAFGNAQCTLSSPWRCSGAPSSCPSLPGTSWKSSLDKMDVRRTRTLLDDLHQLVWVVEAVGCSRRQLAVRFLRGHVHRDMARIWCIAATPPE